MGKVVSLFSGAGGLDWGIESSKHFEIEFANEILKRPIETYEKNFHAEIIHETKEYLGQR